MNYLSLADRATIANMVPEYGATMGFLPVDHVTLQYLKLTRRSDKTVNFSVFIVLLFVVLYLVDGFLIYIYRGRIWRHKFGQNFRHSILALEIKS